MPTPHDNPAAPTARHDGPNVAIQVPVRYETAQRAASMPWRDARKFAQDILAACKRAERAEWLGAPVED